MFISLGLRRGSKHSLFRPQLRIYTRGVLTRPNSVRGSVFDTAAFSYRWNDAR